mmetsp:Transcript_24007/g.36898  ORF Transcript_24007/g.36898 Transcript_24007/m.36898 type:complete len:90 (+) Transcript_24007:1082-1351(+)
MKNKKLTKLTPVRTSKLMKKNHTRMQTLQDSRDYSPFNSLVKSRPNITRLNQNSQWSFNHTSLMDVATRLEDIPERPIVGGATITTTTE